MRRTSPAAARSSVAAALGGALLLAGCTGGTLGHAQQASTPGAPGTPRPHSPVSTIQLPPDTAAKTAAAQPQPRTVTVLGSGDVLIHPPLWEQAHTDAVAEGQSGYDFGPMYAGIAPALHGVDLATCEMETPLAPPQGPFSGWPDFNAPPQVLTALKRIGYRSCTTASNHSIDQGYTGVVRTLDELDAAGLAHTGSARSAAEAAAPLIITAPNGVKIAQLAYAFGFNGIPLPPDKPWLANEINVPAILAAAHRAKQAGADIVVLSMHWGTEYDHLATQEQQDEARTLLASPDIDAILGDHAHVVQPMQKISGKWVIYCMGNQISRHADPIAESREGVMPRFTFTETSPHHFQLTSAEAIPTWMQDAPALRLVDLPVALRDPTLAAAKRTEFRTAYDQIVRYLDAYGAIKDGLVIQK
jgi:poly-gamma-glutamate synthesis protein (capsule biosynthesis protein)